LAQQIFRRIDASQVTQLPELQELNTRQSRELAEQVLGPEFSNFAAHLAEIGSNSPLVIVAGGRLIATRRVNPASLTSLNEFRSSIFNRLIDDMELRGPRFPIDPPRPVLDLIAALGPIDVDTPAFQQSSAQFLERPIDEVLVTIDALASAGVISGRSKLIRIIPDVLSDFVLEEGSISTGDRSTRYAERIYENFGAHSLKNLMRNFAELDWRRGRAEQRGLGLLSGIWADIHRRFQSGDEYERHRILSELSSAAYYQPEQVIRLVRTAIDEPITTEERSEEIFYRPGQDYMLSALPALLEATAHYPEYLRESVDILWQLAHGHSVRGNDSASAQSVLKRLAAWHRYGNPALNFAMLLNAIRLVERPDAFAIEFTPFTLISKIMEREGEFTEWNDETSISFGGFGLNYLGVGPVRESALSYLEYALNHDGRPALEAVHILEDLLHYYLTRAGRQRTESEEDWQGRERDRCLNMLMESYSRPSSPLLKAKVFDALRSATAINCPESIRTAAREYLAHIEIDGRLQFWMRSVQRNTNCRCGAPTLTWGSGRPQSWK
jgi:hypothetical protein